jgi:tRNA(Arg) A34 adenosine deaminase TadA
LEYINQIRQLWNKITPFLSQGRFELKHGNKTKGQVCFFSLFIIVAGLYGCSHINSKPAASIDTGLSKDIKVHEPFIRQTYELALSSGKKGNNPFGALLVYQGKVILTAENTVIADKDETNHAETNLLVKARRELSAEVIKQSTLYVSTAPCTMCSTVMWYMGIRKVVYGVSYPAFAKVAGFKDQGLPCDQVYRNNGTVLEWVGPVLEEEGLQVFRSQLPGSSNSPGPQKSEKR